MRAKGADDRRGEPARADSGPSAAVTTSDGHSRYGARLHGSPARPGRSPALVLERLLEHFVRVGDSPGGREVLVENAGAVLSTIRRAREAGCWESALTLARVAEPAFAASARWGAWSSLLELALEASQAVGDRSAEGWALHQLGVRALALNDVERARHLLGEALAVRCHCGDHEAAEMTHYQLARVAAIS